MATYFIRKTGSDAAAGTSAGAAWLTIGKALGATGIASGDTVWIGAGVYRESVSVAMTSATVETKVYADVDGIQTGDAGEVQWTAYTTNDATNPGAVNTLLMAGRRFLTFQDILFIGSASSLVLMSTNTSTDCTFRRCTFVAGGTGGGSIFTITSAANVALNLTIDSCRLVHGSGSPIVYTPVRPATADFDVNFQIKNCLFIGGAGVAVDLIAASGANTFNPGGVDIYNCTRFGHTFLGVAANWSTTIPCTMYNCFIMVGSNSNTLSATTLGQVIEDYNIIMGGSTTPRVNITAGLHSVSDGSIAPLFFTGHEYYSVGANLKPFGMPRPMSPFLGFGNQAGSPTVDLLGAARPSGTIYDLDNGTATSGATKTITNTGKTFGTNVFAGYTIKIISGTGSGQTKSISSNTATVITVDGNWKTVPDSTSVYEVYAGAPSTSGTSTAGSTTTLTDANAAWGVNMWQTYTLKTDAGTGSGQTLRVISNTATVLTFATATALGTNTTYRLYKGTDENAINGAVGCYESGQTAVRETVTVRTGSNAIRIAGAGYHDFDVPVAAVSTTVTIYTQFDSGYVGTKPTMNVINGTECGVANVTATAIGSANVWEQLSLTFTPTSAGVVTIRLISANTATTGDAFFDDFAVV